MLDELQARDIVSSGSHVAQDRHAVLLTNSGFSMRISVILPAYRAANTIGGTLESVMRQSHAASEILLVDDGSPDDILDTIAPYSTHVTVTCKPNGGAASARNHGIEMSQGDLIAFLDADDYWEPARLERSLDVFVRYPEVGFVFSGYYEETPGTGARIHRPLEGMPLDEPFQAAGRQAFDVACRVSTITVTVRRETLGSERFATDLSTAEDRDLWVRLVLAAPVYCISEPLATAVLEPNSLSRSRVDQDCQNMLRVVHRYADVLGPSGVRDWESRVYRRWAGERLSSGQPALAVKPALRRLHYQPASLEAWWVLGKSLLLSAATRGGKANDAEPGKT
ncbi:MAG: glycosyltransferase family 2 protein [Thermoguttaceae bacterium]|jgi:glycosyltransferase involved in cell wall biosynthesis